MEERRLKSAICLIGLRADQQWPYTAQRQTDRQGEMPADRDRLHIRKREITRYISLMFRRITNRACVLHQ